ncbi:MAG: hypothetical protein WA939_09290 [Nodosilinea sp.]
MDAKVLASGAVGFSAGIVATLLVSVLLMGDMMGRSGMMRGWGCSRSNLSIDLFSKGGKTAPESLVVS